MVFVLLKELLAYFLELVWLDFNFLLLCFLALDILWRVRIEEMSIVTKVHAEVVAIVLVVDPNAFLLTHIQVDCFDTHDTKEDIRDV